MTRKALTAFIVVKKKVYPAPIIHTNKIAYTIITKELLHLLQKDKKRKKSCRVVFQIYIGSNKEGMRSFLTDADIDDTNAEEHGDMFVLASISIPFPAMKKIQNKFGLPPTPTLPQESNKVIIFNKGNSIPPILSSILTVRLDSGGYPELAILDQRTFSTANGVLDEKLCQSLVITGTPVYSEDGKQLYALLVPSKKNPLACFVISSDFYGQSKNINPEKSLEAPSEGSPVEDDNIKVETTGPKDEAFASCSKEGRAPPSLPGEIPTRSFPRAFIFLPNHQKIEAGACAEVKGKDYEEFHSADETSSSKTGRKFEEEGENEISAYRTGSSFKEDSAKEGNGFSNSVDSILSISVDGDIEQHHTEVDNYKTAHHVGDEQQSDRQYARHEPDSLSSILTIEEISPRDPAAINLCDACDKGNEISQLNLYSGYNTPASSRQSSSRQMQVSSPDIKACVFENDRVCSEPAAAEFTKNGHEPDSSRIIEENSPPDAAINLCGAYVKGNEISQSTLDSGYHTLASSRQSSWAFVFENDRVCSEPAATEFTDSGYKPELEGRNRNLASLSTMDSSCNTPRRQISSPGDSGFEAAVADNVGPHFGEHERPLFSESQQADNQHHQPMIEAHDQPVNIEEPNEPPPEESERHSADSPDRIVPNIVQPSSLSEDDRQRNDRVPATLTDIKGPLKFNFPRDCCHQLREADFNQKQELSLRLDKDTLFKDGWYALSKQFDFISEQTRTQLNMAHCGGGCSALSYLLYMSTGPKQMNFSNLLDDCLKLDMSVLVKYMCENVPNSVTGKTLLCDLPYTILQHIATELSPKPRQARNLQKIWKNLAGLNKLHHWEIEAIENSQLQPGLSSPAEELLTFIPTVMPYFKLSYLAKGLIAVNRVDLLTECSIFIQCFQKNCITLIE